MRLWRSCFFFVYGGRSCILQPDNKSLFREGCIVLELTQSTFTGIDKNERYYKNSSDINEFAKWIDENLEVELSINIEEKSWIFKMVFTEIV